MTGFQRFEEFEILPHDPFCYKIVSNFLILKNLFDKFKKSV